MLNDFQIIDYKEKKQPLADTSLRNEKIENVKIQ